MRAIIAAIVALGAAGLSPAKADGSDGYGPRLHRPIVRHYEARPRPRAHRVRSYRSYGGGAYAEPAPAYGPHPPFFPGAGAAAPHGPAVLAEYSEPYIGPGLIYNVPPNPFLVSTTVVRALN